MDMRSESTSARHSSTESRLARQASESRNEVDDRREPPALEASKTPRRTPSAGALWIRHLSRRLPGEGLSEKSGDV